MNVEMVEKMEDGKEKELMKILQDGGKPFIKKHDGYAVKCTEAKTIKWKDHEGNELTLEVPEGSYVVVDVDSNYPSIRTSEDFEKKNKLIESGKSAFRVGKLVKAIEYMDSALLIDPDNKEVQFFKTKTLAKLSESVKSDKRIRAAQDEIGAIAGEEPLESWDEMKSKKGKKKKRKKEKAKAKKEAGKTRSATELEALGFNAFINKDYKKALKYYKNVIAQDPDFPGVKARIKECKDKMGKK